MHNSSMASSICQEKSIFFQQFPKLFSKVLVGHPCPKSLNQIKKIIINIKKLLKGKWKLIHKNHVKLFNTFQIIQIINIIQFKFKFSMSSERKFSSTFFGNDGKKRIEKKCQPNWHFSPFVFAKKKQNNQMQIEANINIEKSSSQRIQDSLLEIRKLNRIHNQLQEQIKLKKDIFNQLTDVLSKEVQIYNEYIVLKREIEDSKQNFTQMQITKPILLNIPEFDQNISKKFKQRQKQLETRISMIESIIDQQQKIRLLAYELNYPSFYINKSSNRQNKINSTTKYYKIYRTYIQINNLKFKGLIHDGIESFIKYCLYCRKIYWHLGMIQFSKNVNDLKSNNEKHCILHIHFGENQLTNKILKLYQGINIFNIKIQEVTFQEENPVFSSKYQNINPQNLFHTPKSNIVVYKIKILLEQQQIKRVVILKYVVCHVDSIKEFIRKDEKKMKYKWLALYQLPQWVSPEYQIHKKLNETFRIVKGYCH